MLRYPNINPEIIRIGSFAIRWYGIMYLIGSVLSYILVWHQIKRKGLNLGREFLDSLYFYLIIGLLVGARLGYVIFYNIYSYIQNPIEIISVWHGGMSFHGGLIGSFIAGILFCKKNQLNVFEISDLVIVTVPIGLGLGRIGNFINGELYGRVTDVPWAMVFPAGGHLSRHPSQLYEAFFEGVILFTVLWQLRDKKLKPGILSALFIILYGFFRFFMEFFREPDPQLGFILGPFTMGQLLSTVIIFAGTGLFYKINSACEK